MNFGTVLIRDDVSAGCTRIRRHNDAVFEDDSADGGARLRVRQLAGTVWSCCEQGLVSQAIVIVEATFWQGIDVL